MLWVLYCSPYQKTLWNSCQLVADFGCLLIFFNGLVFTSRQFLIKTATPDGFYIIVNTLCVIYFLCVCYYYVKDFIREWWDNPYWCCCAEPKKKDGSRLHGGLPSDEGSNLNLEVTPMTQQSDLPLTTFLDSLDRKSEDEESTPIETIHFHMPKRPTVINPDTIHRLSPSKSDDDDYRQKRGSRRLLVSPTRTRSRIIRSPSGKSDDDDFSTTPVEICPIPGEVPATEISTIEEV